MRRLVATTFCFALLAAPASASGTRQSWARAEIKLVTARGLFPGTPATFQPGDPLSAGTLASLITALTARPAATPPTPEAVVSIAQLDAALVDALGLRGAAREFAAGALNAGLRPSSRFGTEVVARLIGLRIDHPASQDSLELEPQQPATRAEAAFSAARMLTLGFPPAATTLGPTSSAPADTAPTGATQYVASAASAFALPELTDLQRQIVQTAISLIGYPYVWGGDDEKVDHGFDCSGFVWRVYKLAAYPEAPALAVTFQGRSAAEMASAVPKNRRIALDDLEPADILFFGSGPKSKAADIGHTAIYLGNGWLIQSSNQGIALAPLDGGYRSSFAWAWRPLAEIA
jgi:cell wall-associated NlpC family hydrolase